MPLLQRNTSKLMIPPVQSTSRDDGSGQSVQDVRDKYSRSNGVGDVYTRAGADSRQLDQDRNELFAGYNPAKSGSGRFFDGPDIDDEDDVEAIKQKTRFKKQESVNSTQNSIRLAREAVATGGNTLVRLGEQAEKLASAGHHLDVAKVHSVRADDKTEELRKLNRSIFIPAITINRDAKHAALGAKVRRRYEEERAEREKKTMTMREAQDRRAGAQGISESSRQVRSAERSRFQFEADRSDDEMEDEIDRNLDEISGLVRALRDVGTAMGEEVDRQNGTIAGLDVKTVKLGGKLENNTVQLHRAGGR
ncbi:hypothetical protein C8R44DRAFT_784625 [Mycena epipterygia]|nr:hypothetical protein C8R44DRAFT_784625 [Mycena epipterygia]